MIVDVETGVDLVLQWWHKATPKQVKQGRTWYLAAHDEALRLAFKYGFHLQIVAGVIAALSPRNKWQDNLKDANFVLRCAANNRLGYITSNRLSSPYPNLDNVFRILAGVNPDKTLGQKAKSFYRCIYNPLTDEVCVDTWAARAVNYTDRWIQKEHYPILQSYYSHAAEEIGTLPPVMQATVWVTIRKSAT